MKFLIIYDEWKPKAKKLARKIHRWFVKEKINSALQPENLDVFSQESTVALVLGGDGFITKKGYELAKNDIPFLGINFGTVGFLAASEPEDWEDAVKKILEGRYETKHKSILKGSLRGEEFDAVNDVVLFRGLQKFVRMKIKVDNKVIYKDVGGDGIIVCSAIGSTAYNLAAGGPTFEVGLGLTPLAIHRIDIQPFTLEENRVIEITCLGGSHNDDTGYILEVDGDNSRTVKKGDKIKVWYTDSPTIKFIVPEGFLFIKALQDKLGLTK